MSSVNANIKLTDRSICLNGARWLAVIVALVYLAAPTLADSADEVWVTAAGHPAEGTIDALMGEPKLEMQQLFKEERFPNVEVAVDGTLLATWGSSSVRLRRSEDGGKSWGDEITIAKPGFQGGGLIVDEKSGDVLCFVEAHHPPAEIMVYRSRDHGKTWKRQETVFNKDKNGNLPSMHMNEHGITLRHGKHQGRLVRPTRWYAGKNDRALWPQHYTNAIYSDNGGHTWQTSDPFPENGTGEAAVAELSDGRIYYNSRVHWQERPKNTRRRSCLSTDGGQTWTDWRIVEILPDGPQDTNYGCMGGLVRLPVRDRDILIYSNCESPTGRNHGTVWASFDGGKTWPIKRLVYEGSFAYSSMTAGRPKTNSEGSIYIHFEGGPKSGSTVARFNLSWLLAGEQTGEGAVPEWVKQKSEGFVGESGKLREEDFTFCVIADPHSAEPAHHEKIEVFHPWHGDGVEKFWNVIDAVNALQGDDRPDFVLIVGDIHAYAVSDLFSRFSCPVHVIAGNHDTLPVGTRKYLRSLFSEDFKVNGKESDYYSFVHKGVRFIGTCDADNTHTGTLSSPFINPDGQRDWIQRQLEIPGERKVIFGHVPTDPTGEGRVMYVNGDDSQFLNDLVVRHGPVAMFFGHQHRATRKVIIGNTPSYTVAASSWIFPAGSSDAAIGFLKVRLSGDQVQTEFIQTGWATDNPDYSTDLVSESTAEPKKIEGVDYPSYSFQVQDPSRFSSLVLSVHTPEDNGYWVPNLSRFNRPTGTEPADFYLNGNPIFPPLEGVFYRRISGISPALLRHGTNVLVRRKGGISGERPHLFALNDRAVVFQTGPVLGSTGPDYFTVSCRTNIPATVELVCEEKQLVSNRALFHQFKLIGLEASREYQYQLQARIGDNDGVVTTTPKTVRTLPTGPPFTFAVLGDSSINGEESNSWASPESIGKHIGKAAAHQKPAFSVFLGNMVQDGRQDWLWDENFFNGHVREFFSTMPCFAVMGHHEHATPLFHKFFATPSGSGNWTQSAGNVLLIGLNGGEGTEAGNSLSQWLEQQLEMTDADFVFLFTHYPAYSSGPNGAVDEAGVPLKATARYARDVIVPLLEKHGATAMFAGHDRNYERSVLPSGLTCITTGGAGAPLCEQAVESEKQNPYSKLFLAKEHYCLLSVTHDACTLFVHDAEGGQPDRTTFSPRLK